MAFKWKHDEIGKGNRNHYTDAYEEFYSLAVNETERTLLAEQVKSNFVFPLINYTNIKEKLDNSKEKYAEVFPRWLALSKAYHPENKAKHTSAYMIAGVSTWYDL